MAALTPKLSVVIPVYNEEQVLPTLFARLYPALDALGISYECVFVNDGSRDRSVALLRQQFQRRPRNTRVVLFHANFGQHSAIMAGFSYARGEYVVTLDADLQNPPEEIGKLVSKLTEGYDYVGTIRQQRQGHLVASLVVEGHEQNSRAHYAGAHHRSGLHDARLCALRGDRAQPTREINTFIPALASLYAMRPIEVPIGHEERYAGQSKYSLYSLIRLNFDLITGFSVVPLQLFSMIGMAVSAISFVLVVILLVRRLLVGPRLKGCSPCSAWCSFSSGLALFGIGLLGEYVGRIYAQVRERPRFIVEAVLEDDSEAPALPGDVEEAHALLEAGAPGAAIGGTRVDAGRGIRLQRGGRALCAGVAVAGGGHRDSVYA